MVCCDGWPAMLNRWFGWLSLSSPVAGSAESVTSQALAACEESSHDEALLGSITVPQANTAAESCTPYVDDGDEVSTREVLEDSSGSNRKLGDFRVQICLAGVTLRPLYGGYWMVSGLRHYHY